MPSPADTNRMTSKRSACMASLALTLGLGLTGLGGCLSFGYREGGNMRSQDAHTYISRTWEPKTVSLIETATGETLWSVDIPVGQQLTVRFYPDNSDIGGDRPDLMRWQLFEKPTTVGQLGQSMAVPPSSNRRLEMSLREVPEFATQ